MRFQPVLLALSMLAPTATFSAELSADCKPVFAAMEKTIQVDHTTTIKHGADTSRGVTIGGAIFTESQGSWHKSALGPGENIARSRENLKSAKEYTCKPLPDSIVAGVPVTNYATHTVTHDAIVDSKISIAKATGLAMQVENTFKADAASGYVTRYTYSDVKAPALR